MAINAEEVAGAVQDDPLAVKVGLWAEDLPCEIWSDEFHPQTARIIFKLLPKDDDLA